VVSVGVTAGNLLAAEEARQVAVQEEGQAFGPATHQRLRQLAGAVLASEA